MTQIPRELAPFLDAQSHLTVLPAKNRKKLPALWYLAGFYDPLLLFPAVRQKALLSAPVRGIMSLRYESKEKWRCSPI